MSLDTVDPKALQELLDRQAILDCIHRYTRGVDRFDRELLLSAYHPDAIDDHGLFVGLAADFVDWAFARHSAHHAAHQHIVTNHICQLDGNTAHTETYWLLAAVNRHGPKTLHGGRYIDRFEKRDGKWAIAARVCLVEWNGVLGKFGKAPPAPEAIKALEGAPMGSRDKSDISYERPLHIKRKMSQKKIRPNEG